MYYPNPSDIDLQQAMELYTITKSSVDKQRMINIQRHLDPLCQDPFCPFRSRLLANIPYHRSMADKVRELKPYDILQINHSGEWMDYASRQQRLLCCHSEC